MKTQKQDLGKVSLTCNGTWDAGKQYDRLCIVNDGNFASYISKKDVPIGTVLSDERFWQPIANLRDDIKIDYETFKKEWLELLASIQIKLRSARVVVANEEARNNLTWLEVAVGCEVYELDTQLTYILDSIVPVINLKSWHLVVGSLLDSEAKFQLDGTYELTAERAIADRWGYIIDEVYVSKKEVKNLVLSIVNDKLENMSITIPPNSITPEDLSQAVLDLIGSGGNVVNNPDEEDITSESLSNGTSVLKFKDRSYVEGTFNGLGEIILRKNQVGIVNLLEQVNINKPNTVYIVRYDFCLGGATITLPKNSTLKFEGGSIDNGTIVGNNSSIVSDVDKTILGKDLVIKGTWNIEHIYDRWFAFDSSSDFLSNQIITNILALSNDNVYNTIHFDADRTYYFELPYKGKTNLGDDVRPNYWKLNTEEYAFLRIFTGVTSNTHLIFNNTLQMIPTNQGAYFIFHIESKENIQISGTGTINADALNHKYTDPFAGSLYYGEWGHIFNFRSCNNIVIKDVTLAYAFGDAIGLGNVGLNIDGNKGCLAATKNVTIDGIKVLYARRNGISLGGNNYSISNVYFEGCGSEAIRGTAPKAAIDFENDYTEIDPSGICTNVVMSNCKFKDNAYDVSSTIRWDLGEVPTGQLVTINGCNFTAPLRLNKTRGLTFNDCHIVGISSHDNSISPWTVSEEWIFNNCNFDELNPYLVVSANDYKHQFNNCTYPEDIQCHKIFRGNLAGTKAIKFSIPKPIPVGELEFVAICTNSSYSIAHLPINTTKYTIGNNTNLVDIRDIRIEARVDSYPKFSMYQQTPVFSYIDYNEDADNINIYFSLGGNITGSPLAGNTEVNIFMNSKTKYIVKEEPVSEGSTAGIYGGKWSEVSAITKTLINISDIPSTVVFPSREMYPNSTMSDLNQITNLKSQRMGTQIYVTDTSYRQPAYWDSTGLTWRTADGNRTLERSVTTTGALDTLTAKLTESDRGYRVYTSVHSSYLTWDGIQWLNEDGSLYSDVKFINKFFTIERLNNAMSNSNVTYKIVGNIDLGGGELTIATGSTLDFQGGSFSNGTIIGNNTAVIADKTVFNNITLDGTFNVDIITDNILSNDNDIDKLKNISKLSSGNNHKKIILNNNYTIDSFPVDSYILFRVYSNTELILNGTITINNISFPSYNIIFCSNAKNIIISGGKIIGDIDSHIGTDGEFGYGITLASCENVVIKDINISKCWGDGIAILRDNWDSPTDVRPCKNITIDNVICDSNRRQGLSVIALEGGLIRNSKFINTGTIKYTAPGYGIDLEPNNQYEQIKDVVIDSCEFTNNVDSVSNYDKSLVLYAPTNKNITNITIKNCITTGELSLNGCKNTIVTNSNIYTCAFNNVTLEDNNTISCNNIRRAEKYSWRDIIKLINNVWAFSAEVKKIFTDVSSNTKLVIPNFVGTLKITVLSNYSNYIKTIYFSLNNTYSKKSYTQFINTGEIGPVVSGNIINESFKCASPIIKDNNIEIVFKPVENSILHTILVEAIYVYLDSTVKFNESKFNIIAATTEDITNSDFSELVINPLRVNDDTKPTNAQAGQICYDLVKKKMILWNGTAWVNLDGTTL